MSEEKGLCARIEARCVSNKGMFYPWRRSRLKAMWGILCLDAWRRIKECRQEEGEESRFNDLLHAVRLRNGRRELKRFVMTRMFRLMATRCFGWRTGVMCVIGRMPTPMKSHLSKPKKERAHRNVNNRGKGFFKMFDDFH